MILYILEYINVSVSSFLLLFFFNAVLIPKMKPLATTAISVALMLAFHSVNLLFPPPQAVKTVAYVVLLLLLVINLYRDSLNLKLMAFGFSFLISSLAEFSLLGFHLLILKQPLPQLMALSFPRILLEAITNILSLSMMIGAIVVWRKKLSSVDSGINVWVFFIYAFSQVSLMLGMLFGADRWGMVNQSVFMAIGFCLSIAAGFYSFHIIDRLCHEAEMEKKMLQLEQNQTLKFEQLKELDTLDRSTKAFCHDINNQLTVIKILIDGERFAEASQMLDSLSAAVAVSGRQKYCANPIVNAVLEQKGAVAALAGIEMTADVHIPEQVSVEPIDLCSVFFNLLDNALEACQLQQACGARRFVEVRAGMSKGYLIAVIKNSKQNEIRTRGGEIVTQKQNALIHGLGISIVQGIAAKYDGTFEIKFTDDTFTANVALRAGA
ncbi:MAG TPA: GHKL domain-containing protein [Candidatus Acidoferrum sp.]|nr:GHKL domain-containing protein [Candidatus Acidoferrum sp.]